MDYEFGEEATRAIATLRPDPIVEIGNPRRFMRYDVRAVGERREARLKQGAGPLGPIAELLVEAIDKLRTEGSPKALQHAIALSSSAIRMGSGKRLSSLTELLVAHGSLEAISKHMMLQLIFGHDVEGALAERCLDQLNARRDERKWEYNQNWFQWEDLLVLMIFGRGVLNNNHSQGQIGPQEDWISEASGRFKKACPEAFEGFVQQGRIQFCARSVLPVREHGKLARTPLAAFFNSPMSYYCKPRGKDQAQVQP